MKIPDLSSYRKYLPEASLILVLLMALWIIFSPWSGLIRFFQINKELAEIQTANQALYEENQKLQAEIDRLKNDPAYQEEVARKQFGLLKNNEILYDFNKKK
jgi:cell division protein FtsB